MAVCGLPPNALLPWYTQVHYYGCIIDSCMVHNYYPRRVSQIKVATAVDNIQGQSQVCQLININMATRNR